MDLDINELRVLCRNDKIKWSLHALKRLRERNISIENFQKCIMNGEIIKQYSNDRPHPSCLILGWVTDETAMHIVVASDEEWLYAITAYYPDEDEWEADMKKRKEK